MNISTSYDIYLWSVFSKHPWNFPHLERSALFVSFYEHVLDMCIRYQIDRSTVHVYQIECKIWKRYIKIIHYDYILQTKSENWSCKKIRFPSQINIICNKMFIHTLCLASSNFFICRNDKLISCWIKFFNFVNEINRYLFHLSKYLKTKELS